LWKWHRIEKGRALGDDEIGLVVALVVGWIGSVCLRMVFGDIFGVVVREFFPEIG
jgi:hypothetical protein